jgi:hypothetical protein
MTNVFFPYPPTLVRSTLGEQPFHEKHKKATHSWRRVRLNEGTCRRQEPPTVDFNTVPCETQNNSAKHQANTHTKKKALACARKRQQRGPRELHNCDRSREEKKRERTDSNYAVLHPRATFLNPCSTQTRGWPARLFPKCLYRKRSEVGFKGTTETAATPGNNHH